MPTGLTRRMAAPLLVVAGAALFGLGAGGIARVDAQLDATARPAAQQQQPAPTLDPHRRVRGERRRPRDRAF
jgi:hypothetical protein